VWWTRWAEKYAKGAYPEKFDELINTSIWKEGIRKEIFDGRFIKVLNMYINESISLHKRDCELAFKIHKKEYSSRKELLTLKKEIEKIGNVRIRFTESERG